MMVLAVPRLVSKLFKSVKSHGVIILSLAFQCARGILRVLKSLTIFGGDWFWACCVIVIDYSYDIP